MAEAAILAALKHLGEGLASQLVQQATSQSSRIVSTISDLESRMNNISSELRVMQAFLDQIDIHDKSNRPLTVWIGEVQNVADTIKGIVDEFIYIVGSDKFGGMKFYFKKLFKEPKSFFALKQIALKLETAENRLKHLGEVKERWVSTTSARIDSGTNNANESSKQLAISAHFIDEHEIIGFDDTREKLTRLINFEEPSLSIISVWGMPGAGKTTLVTNVFKREKNHFTCHAWICISQTYKVDQVLRDLISEISKNNDLISELSKNNRSNQISTNNMDTRELKETVRSLLEGKKYFIVLDDAWDQKAFHNIKDVFVEYLQGSRIIITSRIADVANLARESNRLHLNSLPDKESWNLFCRKAFQFERNLECPPHLDEWAKKIVHKCNGLPLALVSLGSVMSSYGNNLDEWKRVNNQLSWELENNNSLEQLRSILKLSFDHLSKYLKICFLYCCMFPEDYLLARKKLIRLWIAEGFVEQRGELTLEETAEGYLLDLINRSVLQVVEKNHSGRVRRCRMHDTLRDLAISLCTKEKFCLLYGENKLLNIDESTRRLSIIKHGDKIDHHIQLPLLQTLMSFDLSMDASQFVTTRLPKYQYLVVLDLENLSIKSVPDNIGDLFNLHYLGLRGTKVKLLPNSIDKLHNLQTLDLYRSAIQELPDGIAQLKRLRHLFVEVVKDNTGNSIRVRTGIELPKDMFYLKEIQTIQAVESNDMVVRELSNLTQLRSFRIWGVKENHSVELCKSLSNMSFLSLLSINASHENEILHLEGLVLPKIQKLDLSARLGESMLNSPLFQTSGESIQTLWLQWSQLQNDPLSSLFHLTNLTYLFLKRAYEGQELIFQSGWFPKLKLLILGHMPKLINMEMKQGTLESLEEIRLWELKQLAEIPKGIKHLNSLKNMVCRNMPTDFGGLAEGRHKLFHFTCIIQYRS